MNVTLNCSFAATTLGTSTLMVLWANDPMAAQRDRAVNAIIEMILLIFTNSSPSDGI